MDLEIISVDFDDRIKSVAVTLRADYAWYLQITEGAEANLEIQRDVIRDKKAYQTLRNDLAKGCVLPAVVLAANVTGFDQLSVVAPDHHLRARGKADLLSRLGELTSANVQIIDGLRPRF